MILYPGEWLAHSKHSTNEAAATTINYYYYRYPVSSLYRAQGEVRTG